MDYKADFEKATQYKLGRRIYSGDGVIYTLKGQPNRLVKINDRQIDRFKKIVKICKANNPSVVKIYDYGTFLNSYGEKAYFYVMQKLKPLPHKDSDSTNDLMNLIEDASWNKEAPFFVSDKLKQFILQSKKLKLEYRDVHSGNIMLDRFGNFKYIDLESFTY